MENDNKVEDFMKRQHMFDENYDPEGVTRNRTRANGEGSIRKKGNGYEGRFSFIRPGGILFCKSVYSKTRKECNARLTELRNNYSNTADGAMSKFPTLIEWSNVWLSEFRKDLAFVTRKRYQGVIERLKSAVEDKPLPEIRSLELQQFLNGYESYEMCNRALGILKEILQSAIDNGFIVKNPAATLRVPLSPTAPKFNDSKKAFTQNEESDFVALIKSNPYRLLYLISLYAGLRRGEVCALKWESIDLDKRLIYVKDAVSRKANGYQIGKTKTTTSVRAVPICENLYKILNAADKSRIYVFERGGKVLNADSLTTDFISIMKQLKLKHTLHQLRHTFATRCANKGIDPKVVQLWMGHSKVDMTLNTYTHATDDTIKNALKLLD